MKSVVRNQPIIQQEASVQKKCNFFRAFLTIECYRCQTATIRKMSRKYDHNQNGKQSLMKKKKRNRSILNKLFIELRKLNAKMKSNSNLAVFDTINFVSERF